MERKAYHPVGQKFQSLDKKFLYLGDPFMSPVVVLKDAEFVEETG